MFALSRRRVIVLVVLTGLLLITLDKSGNPVIDSGRSVVSRLLRPFETAVEAVALPVERAWNGVTRVDDLERENDALRDQIAHMKGTQIEAQSAILAYRELLKVNQLASKFQFDVKVAQVVGDSPSNFQNSVEINVGSANGIEVGMAVTDGAGLIGRITEVFADRSIVLLITDPEFSVKAQVLSTAEQVAAEQVAAEESATTGTTPSGVAVDDLTTTTSTSTTTTTLLPVAADSSTSTTVAESSSVPEPVAETTTSTIEVLVLRETGSLEGRGVDRPLVLRFIDTTSALTSPRVGSIVDTAGGGGSLAPQGIPIGRITRVVEQSGTSSAIVEVTPNASLDRLNFVAVILFVPDDAGVDA